MLAGRVWLSHPRFSLPQRWGVSPNTHCICTPPLASLRVQTPLRGTFLATRLQGKLGRLMLTVSNAYASGSRPALGAMARKSVNRTAAPKAFP